MSVQALGWVFDHSPTEGSDRLVLLSIANHAGESPVDGAWEAWPGIELIRRETGLRRERTVKDSLARLVAVGAVERIINGAPDERIRRDRRSNLYRISLDYGVPCAVTRCRWCGVTRDAERGDVSRPDGVTLGDRTGVRDASPEPSVEPTDEPSGEPKASSELDALPEIRALCEQLADRIHQHRGGEDRPRVTARWVRDMRLLVERGPLGVDDPREIPVEKVASSIDYLYARLADPDGGGFCWADVVRSPNALRKHWPKMRDAARRQQATTVGRGGRAVDRAAAAAGRDPSPPSSGLDRVEPSGVGDLLRRGRAIETESRTT